MTRWLWTVAIVALLGLTAGLPYTGIGRRGVEAQLRNDVETTLRVGRKLPPLVFEDLAGRPVRSEDLLGQRVLLTFERSVDW
jgi:hypothetical protein